jgi:NADPH-dependent curcumin reductase
MSAVVNHQWRLISRPVGNLEESDFEWTSAPVPEPGEGEVLVRVLYLSLDPTYRMWAATDTYLPAVPLGEVMRGITIGVVEKSRHSSLPEGTHVQGLLGWQEFAVCKPHQLTILPPLPGVPLDAHFGLFGHIGMTAYFGLLDIGHPQPGETLVVSAAAGAVGSLVGQIGKLKGCRVVGIAGSDEKCRWLVDDLGFEGAINYKNSDLPTSLKEQCPDGIDVDFENVGGAILDAVLTQINLRARIILCGLISGYNATTPQRGPAAFGNILIRRARVEGFIVTDYQPRALEAMTAIGQWYAEGKIKYRIDQIDGLAQAPKALSRLFTGENIGKLLVKL